MFDKLSPDNQKLMVMHYFRNYRKTLLHNQAMESLESHGFSTLLEVLRLQGWESGTWSKVVEDSIEAILTKPTLTPNCIRFIKYFYPQWEVGQKLSKDAVLQYVQDNWRTYFPQDLLACPSTISPATLFPSISALLARKLHLPIASLERDAQLAVLASQWVTPDVPAIRDIIFNGVWDNNSDYRLGKCIHYAAVATVSVLLFRPATPASYALLVELMPLLKQCPQDKPGAELDVRNFSLLAQYFPSSVLFFLRYITLPPAADKELINVFSHTYISQQLTWICSHVDHFYRIAPHIRQSKENLSALNGGIPSIILRLQQLHPKSQPNKSILFSYLSTFFTEFPPEIIQQLQQAGYSYHDIVAQR